VCDHSSLIFYFKRLDNDSLNFEQHKDLKRNFRCVSIHGDNIDCDCKYFLKNYICKHILGIQIQRKYVLPPLEATLLPLGQKRKPGRPRKMGPALGVQ
jgi:hypothetical protein